MSEVADPLTLLPPVYVLEVRLVATETLALPGWLGSTLHGALGESLRALGCSPRCESLHDVEPGRCAFTRLFAPPMRRDVPPWISATAAPPMALRPPPPSKPKRLGAGAQVTFGIVLVGERTMVDLDLLLGALQRMAARGLGKGRSALELVHVRSVHGPVWEGGQMVALPPAAAPLRRDPNCPVTLRALTPLCIVRDGRPSVPRFEDLVAACARRVLVLASLHGTTSLPEIRIDSLRERARTHTTRIESVWMPFRAERWSSRQKRRHPVEGYLGHMEVSVPGAFVGWLEAAALVGVGKGTALGLGHMELE